MNAASATSRWKVTVTILFTDRARFDKWVSRIFCKGWEREVLRQEMSKWKKGSSCCHGRGVRHYTRACVRVFLRVELFEMDGLAELREKRMPTLQCHCSVSLPSFCAYDCCTCGIDDKLQQRMKFMFQFSLMRKIHNNLHENCWLYSTSLRWREPLTNSIDRTEY